MRKISREDRAGLYLTVIIHLAVVIVLLIAGLDMTLKKENSFVLDFSKLEEKEKMIAEIERLQKQAELQEAINRKIQEQLGAANSSAIRNVAVDRASLKDDRGTDAEQLYKDAERLAKDLKQGFSAPDENIADPNPAKKEEDKPKKESKYSGPSVVSYDLGGRKASHLAIPAYRCMGAGEVKVLVTVDNKGIVKDAKIDESCSSADDCLRRFAIRAARMSKFSADPNAPFKQNGNIVYQFISQY